ncbi:MAG: glycosyltransferase involved in cell wall biosynthesis [Polaribacter sp.]|jgi:glycosyltransferase involved in cell wall biosynthesis
MKPTISVIVPVYNVEKFLHRCVDSLLNQSYKNIEIILVNDGSTDGSASICNNYRDTNKNIKVTHHDQSSGSAGASRNSGLNMAIGEYISFIDSDDWIHPEMMKSMLAAIKFNDTEIAECDLIRTNEYKIDAINDIDLKNTIVETRLEALKRIVNNQRFSVCVRLYQHSLIKDIRFPENVISEDVYFTLSVFNNIINLVRINIPFYYYHETPNSITRKVYNLKYLETLKSSLFLQESIQKNEKDQELLIAIQYFILKELIFHYKMLNYYPKVDPKYTHRKRLKKLIDKNFFNSKSHDSNLKLANSLSVTSFEAVINLNKLKHKVLRKNPFS